MLLAHSVGGETLCPRAGFMRWKGQSILSQTLNGGYEILPRDQVELHLHRIGADALGKIRPMKMRLSAACFLRCAACVLACFFHVPAPLIQAQTLNDGFIAGASGTAFAVALRDIWGQRSCWPSLI